MIEISGSHGGEDEADILLGYSAVYCRRSWPTFQRLLPQSSGWHIRNIDQFLPEYMTQCPSRHPCSYSTPWEPEVSQSVALLSIAVLWCDVVQCRMLLSSSLFINNETTQRGVTPQRATVYVRRRQYVESHCQLQLACMQAVRWGTRVLPARRRYHQWHDVHAEFHENRSTGAYHIYISNLIRWRTDRATHLHYGSDQI
jgi:hypothetical protein